MSEPQPWPVPMDGWSFQTGVPPGAFSISTSGGIPLSNASHDLIKLEKAEPSEILHQPETVPLFIVGRLSFDSGKSIYYRKKGGRSRCGCRAIGGTGTWGGAKAERREEPRCCEARRNISRAVTSYTSGSVGRRCSAGASVLEDATELSSSIPYAVHLPARLARASWPRGFAIYCLVVSRMSC
uniref:Uncharacterized protein n=1 Tax=Heterorhabditis bacteriophora TaxID=37862 RepID=A0A1I7XHN2_HETBA